MKTNKYHIIRSWILLTCFIAGQFMIYAHQHNTVKSTFLTHKSVKSTSQQTVSEKCRLCDVMHHNKMVATTHVYACPADSAVHVFKSFEYNFTSIQLILSCGRAPPSPVYS